MRRYRVVCSNCRHTPTYAVQRLVLWLFWTRVADWINSKDGALSLCRHLERKPFW